MTAYPSGYAAYHRSVISNLMKNPKIEISNNWKILRDEFLDIDPLDKSISENEKSMNLFLQEDLMLLNNGEYFIDLGWYGGNQNGCYKLSLYKGKNWHNCQLLEKYSTIEYQFLTKSINTIARNVDDKFYDELETENGSIDDFSAVELFSKFQITHSILKHPDKIFALEFYLKSNKNDNEGDSWIFGHNPNIIEHLKTFNKEEYERLNKESELWDDKTISNLADPIWQCGNSNIQGKYFYCKIFLQINLKDELEYLVENLAAIARDIKTIQPKEFFEKLIAKSKEVNEGSEGNYEYTINQLEKIKADNIKG